MAKTRNRRIAKDVAAFPTAPPPTVVINGREFACDRDDLGRARTAFADMVLRLLAEEEGAEAVAAVRHVYFCDTFALEAMPGVKHA